MSDVHGNRNGREYLWFAAALLILLATIAGHSASPATASIVHELTAP